MEDRMMKFYSKESNMLALHAMHGHFATSHSHINYYVDVTSIKTRVAEAKQAAHVLYSRIPKTKYVDTIVCMDGTEVVGTFLTEEIQNGGIMGTTNQHETVYVISPEINSNNQMLFRDNNKGAIKVTQKMTADKNAKVSPMFRFGMQMPMPRYFENIEYYGRGPVENYIDRKGNADLAIYRQTVDEQFYSYIRPQENGTKSDIRWWKMLNEAGNGIEVVASAPFSASALHYTIESLDDGARKDQRHSPEVEEADLTNLCLDKVQMGLGCVNSWGTIALPEYQIPYGDYEFTFILTPVKHSIEIE